MATNRGQYDEPIPTTNEFGQQLPGLFGEPEIAIHPQMNQKRTTEEILSFYSPKPLMESAPKPPETNAQRCRDRLARYWPEKYLQAETDE